MTEPLLAKSASDRLNEYLSPGQLLIDEEWGDHYKAPIWSFYDRLFLKHKNAEFGEHFERAGRGALFVLVMGIPFIFLAFKSDVYTPTSIIFLLFAFYNTTGDTIHFAMGGVSGTGLAVLNIWLLNGFFPGGYAAQTTDAIWFAGACWGSLSIVLVLWLNFEVNTKIFYLSTFVWYLMDFLSATNTIVFCTGFSVNLNGQEAKELSVAIFGSAMGIVAALLPFPVNAKDKSLVLAKSLVMHLQMCKLTIVSDFTSDERSEMTLALIRTELKRLQEEMVGMAPLLDASWYECLGLTWMDKGLPGKWQRQRVMTKKLAAYVSKTIDLVSTVAGACETETYKDHKEFMIKIKPYIDNIVRGNGKVLKICMAGVYNGHFDEFLIQQGEEAVRAPAEEVKRLTREFCMVRSQTIDNESANLHIFVTAFCLTQQYTKELFNDMSKELHEKEVDLSHFALTLGGLLESEVVSDSDHISWAVRNSISIILAFFLGHFGYAPFLQANDANISSTCSVLLSKFTGSAMTKNLSRMQGVVLGIVFGNMVHSLLGYCDLPHQVVLALVLVSASWMGLFLYFHSTSFGTVGLLLTVFGIKSMLLPCSQNPSVDAGSSYSQIVTCTVAIFIMTVVDTLLMPARASDLAVRAVNRAFEGVLKSVQSLLDNEKMDVPSREGRLGSLIAAAKGLGAEAALEPRYWREDWPASLFDRATGTLMKLRHNVRTIEENVLELAQGGEHKGERVKNASFLEVLQLRTLQESYTGLRSILLSHLEAVQREVEWGLNDKVKHDVFLKRKELKIIGARETAMLWPEALEAFASEITALMKKQNEQNAKDRTSVGAPRQVESMVDDKLADAAILIKSLRSIFESLDELLTASVS